jgi:hypothetical protein
MPSTRRYSIEIKDPDNKSVVFTAADWTDEEMRIAAAQILRLVGTRNDNCLTQPAPERDKD